LQEEVVDQAAPMAVLAAVPVDIEQIPDLQ
jgi:hypothetical protein